MKHKYLRELFPNDTIWPQDEEDYHDFDRRDTFNMNYTLVAWLYECLRCFQDEASKIVDFDHPLYIGGEQVLIDGKEVTQRQCIDRMVEDCKIILLYDCGADFDDFQEEIKYVQDVVEPAKNDLFDILSETYWAMWW